MPKVVTFTPCISQKYVGLCKRKNDFLTALMKNPINNDQIWK